MKKIVSFVMVVIMMVTLLISTTSVLATEFERGDINEDSSVDNKDVVTLFRALSMSGEDHLTNAMDFNEDGKVNNKDVVSLFRFTSTIVSECDHDYDWDNPEYVTELCYEIGIYTCKKCGKQRRVPVKALGHTWGKDVRVVNPTCEDYGYTVKTCVVCGFEDQVDRTDPTGHDYNDWVVTKNPTETEPGMKERVCKNCNHKETEQIRAIENKWEYYVYKTVIRDHNTNEIKRTNYTLKTEDDIFARCFFTVFDMRTWGEEPILVRTKENGGTVTWDDKDGVKHTVELTERPISEGNTTFELYDDGTWQEIIVTGFTGG